MDSLEEQSFHFLSLFLSVQSDEEEAVRLEERGGGGQTNQACGPAPTPTERELISKLQSHQPQTPKLLENSVPSHLPESLKSDIPSVTFQSLNDLYDIDESARHVDQGRLTSIDVISSYVHSFRNIWEYELSDQGAFHLRFLRYFSRIFSEMVERIVRSDVVRSPTLVRFFFFLEVLYIIATVNIKCLMFFFLLENTVGK